MNSRIESKLLKERIALLIHIAFYVRWPKASAALNIVGKQ
ncbi:alkylhydroperoxidase/carboxymuconolactone decarboxylase family protein YurZ [Priestia megaterium]|nr:alkylhydroperoxidase/carboxymuconolactone decarboxylase family protein YurZ [Priestia megaterium]